MSGEVESDRAKTTRQHQSRQGKAGRLAVPHKRIITITDYRLFSAIYNGSPHPPLPTISKFLRSQARADGQPDSESGGRYSGRDFVFCLQLEVT